MSDRTGDRSDGAGGVGTPDETPVTPSSTSDGGKPAPGVDKARISGRDLARAALADAQSMAARRRVDQAAGIHPRVQKRRRRNLEANTARRTWSGAGADDRDPQPIGAVVKALFAARGWEEPVTAASVFTDWTRLSAPIWPTTASRPRCTTASCG